MSCACVRVGLRSPSRLSHQYPLEPRIPRPGKDEALADIVLGAIYVPVSRLSIWLFA